MTRIAKPTGLRTLVANYGAHAYALVFLLAYAVSIFAHRVPASLTDYSDWTYEGVLLHNRLLGLPDAAHILKHYPVPNSAATLGIAAFASFVSWQLAAKLWLGVLILSSYLATRHMMTTRRGQQALWLIVPGAVFLNVNFWYGFVNFQLGLCCAVLLASLMLRDEHRDWIFGALLTCAFFSHMIPFAFSSLLLILYAWQSDRLRLLWQLVPGVLLTAWYLLGRFVQEHDADGHAGMLSPVRSYSAAFWAYKVNSYLKSFGFINPGSPYGSGAARILGPPLFLLMFVLNLILCIALGRALVAAALAAYREHKKERFIWTAGLVVLPLYLLAPGTALWVSDPGSRILQSWLAAAIFLCAPQKQGGVRSLWGAGACAVALQIAGLYLFEATAFSPQREVATIAHLPRVIVVFAHVPNHAEDFYLRALEEHNLRLRIFPTAMFLDTTEAEIPVPETQPRVEQ